MNRPCRQHVPDRHSPANSTPKVAGMLVVRAVAGLIAALVLGGVAASQEISRAAATSCGAKVDKLEVFAASAAPGKKQTTRFTQQEINSYLALDLSSKYSPSLKSLTFTFENDRLQGDAVIDFDRLGMSASRLLTKLMASMLSGTHRLSARGKIIAQGGKAQFQLEDAKFDNTGLPNFLVEEIISAVGRRQRPPFDPMQPSQMPYRIEKVVIRVGYIIVYQ
ncbi:MAG TPA: hypothetical protein VE398_08380 [Acidobacteriota bacterium]|nr:hypothetical protein [Acidobacteriota bacterium]